MSVEENKTLVRRWLAEIDRGNLEAVDELVSPDYVDHNPPIPGFPPGREGLKQVNLLLHAAFPDAVHVIEEQIAEGDKVMTRVSGHATFTGEFLGYAPTGRVVQIGGVSVHRIVDGKLVEHWANADMASFMQQIGASPGPSETTGRRGSGPPTAG